MNPSSGSAGEHVFTYPLTTGVPAGTPVTFAPGTADATPELVERVRALEAAFTELRTSIQDALTSIRAASALFDEDPE